MYCRNCGKEVNEKAEICVNCGVRPLAEKKFCQECGVVTNPNQELCIKCGVRLKTLLSTTASGSPINTDFSSLPQYYQDEFKKIYGSNETYKGKWNWAAFCFGPIWALTKGVWLSSVIDIVASFVTSGVAGLIYWFIFAIRGNFMYYSAYVKNKQLIV
jgi:RNA polymerase subunit RPABC4/transcription elongation factor Spt4